MDILNGIKNFLVGTSENELLDKHISAYRDRMAESGAIVRVDETTQNGALLKVEKDGRKVDVFLTLDGETLEIKPLRKN